MIAYDSKANFSPRRHESNKTYALFIDKSGRINKEDVAKFSGPVSDISLVEKEYPGLYFRAAIDHPDKKTFWEVLDIYYSLYKEPFVILPIFEIVSEYRMICVALLYALSIIVRYRPSVWRRIQEGDLDYMRVIIEAFLDLVERVLPHQFLEKMIGKPVFIKLPGAFI